MKRYTNGSAHGSLEELWLVQIELALKFKEICTIHNLKYFLTGGGLLGAARLSEYIPWNDSLEFFMPREDYDKLFEIANEEIKEPYFFQTPSKCNDIYYGGNARLRHSETACINPNDVLSKCNQGIWIDIKPLDYVYNDLQKRNKQLKKIRRYQCLSYAKHYSESKKILDVSDFKWSLYIKIARYLNKDFLVSQERKWRMACRKSNEVACFDYNIKRYNPKIFAKEIFNNGTEMVFENHHFKVPRNYHSVLRTIYGNSYLTPPPVTQRIPKLLNYYVDTKVSYKEYLKTLLRDKSHIPEDALTFNKALEKTIILYGTNIMIDTFLRNTSDQYYPEFIVSDKSDQWFVKLEGYDLTLGTFDDMLNIPREERVVIVCATNYIDYLAKLMKLGISEAYVFCDKHVDIVNQFSKNNILFCLNGFPVVYDMEKESYIRRKNV